MKHTPFVKFKTGFDADAWANLTPEEQHAAMYPKKGKPQPEREPEPDLGERVRRSVGPTNMQIVEMSREELDGLPRFSGLH